jgi:hypothetical protein
MQRSDHFVLKGMAHLLLAFLLIISACSDDDEPSVHQIVNDDVEGSIAWQFVNVAPAAHAGVVVNSASASSSHSLSISSSEVKADGFSFWSLKVTPPDIPVGASLELTVKVKVTNVTGEGVFVALRGDGDSSSSPIFFESTQDIRTIDGTADFTTYGVKLDSYPEGVTQIYIFLIMDASGTGTANFDDISLISHH